MYVCGVYQWHTRARTDRRSTPTPSPRCFTPANAPATYTIPVTTPIASASKNYYIILYLYRHMWLPRSPNNILNCLWVQVAV